MQKTPFYTDLDMRMIAHPISSDVNPLYDHDAIKQAIINIVLSDEFCGIGPTYLFEQSSTMISGNIQKIITNALTKYEPRINIKDIEIELTSEGSGVAIGILYEVKATYREDKIEYFLKVR